MQKSLKTDLINSEQSLKRMDAPQFIAGWCGRGPCNIVNMDIQHKVGDASDLQSGGGTAGVEGDMNHAHPLTEKKRYELKTNRKVNMGI